MIKPIEKIKEDKEILEFRKKEKALNYASTVTIVIPDMSREELSQKACDMWNDGKSAFLEVFGNTPDENGHVYKFVVATVNDKKEVVTGRIFNYIRHRLTTYHRVLYNKFGVTGEDEAYKILMERICKAAVRKFKWLE